MKKYTKFLMAIIVLLVLCVAFAACSKTVTRLSTPKNLAIAGNTLSWDEVENAEFYEIILNSDNPIVIKENYYDLAITKLGSYEVKVRAKTVNSKNITVYSDYAELSFNKTNKLATPTLKIEDKILSWDEVANASSYTIKIYDSSDKIKHSITINDLQFDLDENGKEDPQYSATGAYTISVVANPSDDSYAYATSDASTINYYISQVLATPQISGVSSTSVRWTAISNIKNYTLALYYDIEGTSQDEKVAEYNTTSNTYALSAMDFDKDGKRRAGKYYCVVKANGDDNVYISSSYCSRNEEFDLNVLPEWDTSSITYNDDNILSWTIDGIENYKSFTILLKATNSVSSSSLDTIEKVINVDDENRVANYVEATQYVSGKEYFVKEDEVYSKANGGIDYIPVNTGITIFDTSEKYFKREGNNYIEITSGYIKANEYSQGKIYFVKIGTDYIEQTNYKYIGDLSKAQSMSNDTVFYKRDSNNSYSQIGKITDVTFDDTLNEYYVEGGLSAFIDDIDYYTYYKFDHFENDVDYYVLSYKPLTEFEQGKTYYEVSNVTYSYNINDFFFTYENGEYTFLKNDDNYYGKLFSITLSLNALKNTIITSSAITLDEQYLSFKKPNSVSAAIAFEESKIKNYFENEQEYQSFVNKYNGYYYIETLGELRFMAIEQNAKYVLMTNLDAQKYNWVTIENFSGILDGNNHSIKNITYFVKESNVSQNVGLVGQNSGVIKNLFLVDVNSNFSVTEGVFGGIAGVNENEISNCYISGQIEGLTTAGGLVGINNGVIKNSQASCEVTSQVAGGLVGINSGSIIACGSTNKVNSKTLYKEIGVYDDLENIGDDIEIFGLINDDSYVLLGTKSQKEIPDTYNKYYYAYMPIDNIAGGLVAKNEIDATINNSYSINDVSVRGNNSIAGGLVGENKGNITASYSGAKYSNNTNNRSLIIANGNNTTAGGFVGVNKGSISIASSTSRAAAGLCIGGFVGLNEGNIDKAYATGGTEIQSVDTRGAFTGKNTGVITNSYFYNHFTNQTYNNTDSSAVRKMSLNEIMQELSSSGFATLDRYMEPVVIGVIYSEGYEDTKMAGALVLINTNIVIDSDTVINLTSDENAPYFWVGDNLRKGDVLYVITYEGMMVVFDITIK